MSSKEIEKQRANAINELAILDTPREERFECITRLAQHIFNTPVAQVTVLDGDRQWYKSNRGYDVNELPRSISFCTHTVEEKDGTMVVSDASKDQRFDDNPAVHSAPYVKFYAGISLAFIDGTRIGTFCIIDTKPRQFSEKEMEILKDLASIAERELVTIQLAMTDELTGLLNRRGFMSHSKTLLSLAQRNNKKMVLAYLDLDNFKHINDTFGHEEGDKALKLFAKALEAQSRSSDLIGRLGGDEFVFIFASEDGVDSKNYFKRLQNQLAEVNRDLPYQIEFSCGIVEYDEKRHDSIEVLLKEADKNMYKNKHA